MTHLVSMVERMDNNSRGRVLVVGMGISGLATASRLHAAGWTPTIIERSPERRGGGYMVALFGAGQIAARRLGLLDGLHNRMSTEPSLDVDPRGGGGAGVSLGGAAGAARRPAHPHVDRAEPRRRPAGREAAGLLVRRGAGQAVDHAAR